MQSREILEAEKRTGPMW